MENKKQIEDLIEQSHDLPYSVNGSRVVRDLTALIKECRSLRSESERFQLRAVDELVRLLSMTTEERGKLAEAEKQVEKYALTEESYKALFGEPKQ